MTNTQNPNKYENNRERPIVQTEIERNTRCCLGVCVWKINIHWRSLDFSLSLGSPPCSGGSPVKLRAVWRLNAQQALTAPPHVCTSFGSYKVIMFIASRGPELDPPGPEPRGPIPILPAPPGVGLTWPRLWRHVNQVCDTTQIWTYGSCSPRHQNPGICDPVIPQERSHS